MIVDLILNCGHSIDSVGKGTGMLIFSLSFPPGWNAGGKCGADIVEKSVLIVNFV